jgi:aerobic carbon-monoxide dehydrogenase small subunit
MTAPERTRTVEVQLTVNGTRHTVRTAPNRTLVQVLREELRLTGTKEACSIGVCGVCTVLLNGRTVSACLLLAQMVQGAQIVTIEGIGTPDRLDPVQQAFIDRGGFQCGICTPGQIVAATALLNEHPAPTRAQVTEWMAGNFCRCTGYYPIVESVLAAAEARR